jgi:hypothetical protein
MNNKIHKTISKICERNNIYLVDSEIRIISSRIELLNKLQNKEQTGGNINNKKIINKNLNSCLSPLFILQNTNEDTIKNMLFNILKGNLMGTSLICSKYTK